MTKIMPKLLECMQADPDAEMRLIVRVNGDPAQAAEHLAAGPMRVLRQFTLVPGMAVAGKAG
ncbi:MAG: hypothetical protein KJ734_02475, partial [Chloroflexi bacterium]|nr:hypothetical protein [Chloroflexota bacterium]